MLEVQAAHTHPSSGDHVYLGYVRIRQVSLHANQGFVCSLNAKRPITGPSDNALIQFCWRRLKYHLKASAGGDLELKEL
jgi:hypothetical protein